MANKKNNEGISIFIFIDKAKEFTEKDEKNYNTKIKKLLNKSLSFIDEKDKHGLRLINQIIDTMETDLAYINQKLEIIQSLK